MHYDAIVIGAGIIGLSTAYHIKRKNPQKSILVIEKESSPGFGATGKSAGCFQGFFKSEISRKLAVSSIEFYKDIERRAKYNFKIRWTGFLWLLNEKQYEEIKKDLKEMKAYGTEHEIIDNEMLMKNLKVRINVKEDQDAKIIGLNNIHVGLLAKYAGTISVESLLKFYEKEFMKLGGKIIYNHKVNRIIIEPYKSLNIPEEPYYWQEKRIAGVEIDGKKILANKTIIAAGGWIQKILDNVGVDSHIKPLKKNIYVIKAKNEKLKEILYAKGFNREGCMPFTIIPHPEVYVKPEIDEETFWIGHGLTLGNPFKVEREYLPDLKFYEKNIYPVLKCYFPQFKNTRPLNAWSSIYEVTTIDRQPVIFEENDLIVVGGGSGYGIMKADAIGRIASAVFSGDKWAKLYGDIKIRCSDLSIKHRRIEEEVFLL
ncbi:MAG: FAD-binding oxidoreductase [archaeon GB-1867-035]|nr:FAD-binding oxidoreductase [Candidatus Culexmicrobium profundum]